MFNNRYKKNQTPSFEEVRLSAWLLQIIELLLITSVVLLILLSGTIDIIYLICSYYATKVLLFYQILKFTIIFKSKFCRFPIKCVPLQRNSKALVCRHINIALLLFRVQEKSLRNWFLISRNKTRCWESWQLNSIVIILILLVWVYLRLNGFLLRLPLNAKVDSYLFYFT